MNPVQSSVIPLIILPINNIYLYIHLFLRNEFLATFGGRTRNEDRFFFVMCDLRSGFYTLLFNVDLETRELSRFNFRFYMPVTMIPAKCRNVGN